MPTPLSSVLAFEDNIYDGEMLLLLSRWKKASSAYSQGWDRRRADDLIYDFQIYPNYQKLPKFSNKSTTAEQNMRAKISSARN